MNKTEIELKALCELHKHEYFVWHKHNGKPDHPVAADTLVQVIWENGVVSKEDCKAGAWHPLNWENVAYWRLTELPESVIPKAERLQAMKAYAKAKKLNKEATADKLSSHIKSFNAGYAAAIEEFLHDPVAFCKKYYIGE